MICVDRRGHVEKIYPNLGKRVFVHEWGTNPQIEKLKMVHEMLLPRNHPDNVSPYVYIYKNALIELALLKNYNVKMEFLSQLHLMVLANTPTYEGKESERDVKLVLFSDFTKNNQHLEYLVAFYNGLSIMITANFLRAVMGKKENQSIEDYLISIECRFQKESNHKSGIIFFKELAKSMVSYGVGDHNSTVVKCTEILQQGKSLILYKDRELEITLVHSGGFHLRVCKDVVDETEQDMGWGGLLSNMELIIQEKGSLLIDPVTANSLMVYFSEEDDRFLDEGEDFLFHVLAFYPG